jgi:hypothetical protein
MRVVRSELLESRGHINGKLAIYLRFLNFTFKHSEDCDDDVTRTRSTFTCVIIKDPQCGVTVGWALNNMSRGRKTDGSKRGLVVETDDPLSI